MLMVVVDKLVVVVNIAAVLIGITVVATLILPISRI